jgi:hypothetical protein
MRMKEIKNLKVGDELKVVKSLFYFSEDSLIEGEWYSKEDIFESLSELICEGDVWKVIGFIEDSDNEIELECIKGRMEGESNDGWFSLENVYDKNCFEMNN